MGMTRDPMCLDIFHKEKISYWSIFHLGTNSTLDDELHTAMPARGIKVKYNPYLVMVRSLSMGFLHKDVLQ